MGSHVATCVCDRCWSRKVAELGRQLAQRALVIAIAAVSAPAEPPRPQAVKPQEPPCSSAHDAEPSAAASSSSAPQPSAVDAPLLTPSAPSPVGDAACPEVPASLSEPSATPTSASAAEVATVEQLEHDQADPIVPAMPPPAPAREDIARTQPPRRRVSRPTPATSSLTAEQLERVRSGARRPPVRAQYSPTTESRALTIARLAEERARRAAVVAELADGFHSPPRVPGVLPTIRASFDFDSSPPPSRFYLLADDDTDAEPAEPTATTSRPAGSPARS